MNILKLNWIIYAAVTAPLILGTLAFVNGTTSFGGQLLLGEGNQVAISSFRLFETPLRVSLSIGKSELERRRSEVNVDLFPADCLKHQSPEAATYLHYVQEMAEKIRLDVSTGDGGSVTLRSPEDKDGYGVCGVLGRADSLDKPLLAERSSSQEQSDGPNSPAPEVMLRPGWSRVTIKVLEVGPLLKGDLSEAYLDGPINLKHGSGVPAWDKLFGFFLWPVYVVIDLLWLLILVRLTFRRRAAARSGLI